MPRPAHGTGTRYRPVHPSRESGASAVTLRAGRWSWCSGTLHGLRVRVPFRARFAVPAERCLHRHRGIVDTDGARLDPAGHFGATLEIGGENEPAEAEVRVVCDADSLVVVRIGHHDDDWTEYLLTGNAHFVGDVAEDRGCVVVPGTQRVNPPAPGH